MIPLRDYQHEALDAIADAEARGVTRQLVSHPTATGKTVTFSHLLTRREQRRMPSGDPNHGPANRGRGRGTVVLCHRDELVRQAVDKIRTVSPDLPVGVVKAREDECAPDVVVASVQTLAARGRIERLGPRGLVIVDEAHHAVSRSWTDVLTRLECFADDGPLTVGFTATPVRGDGVGLGKVFQELVHRRGIAEMTAAGYLAPLRGQLVRIDADMSGVRVQGGDLAAGGVGSELERSGSIPQIARAWIDHGEGRKTVAFTPTVRTAHRLADELAALGVSAEAFDGSTPADDRRGVLHRLHTGETTVAVNCCVLTEGFDEASIECILMARPTQSEPLFTQIVGRGTRLHPGKRDCLVLDVTDTSERNKLVTVSDITGSPSSGERDDAERGERGTGSSGRGASSPATYTGRVDLFGSRMRWLAIDNGYCLPAGNYVVVLVPDGGDTYSVVSQSSGKRAEKVSGSLPIDWAQGVGEDLCQRLSEYEATFDRGARWLRRPPTEAQLRYLSSIGVDVSRVTSRGLASDTITRHRARGVIRKFRAS